MPFFVSLIRRLVSMLLVLLVVVVLNFLMLHLAPGDIADTIAQTMGGADEQDMAELRQQYGLDQPFLFSCLTMLLGLLYWILDILTFTIYQYLT